MADVAGWKSFAEWVRDAAVQIFVTVRRFIFNFRSSGKQALWRDAHRHLPCSPPRLRGINDNLGKDQWRLLVSCRFHGCARQLLPLIVSAKALKRKKEKERTTPHYHPRPEVVNRYSRLIPFNHAFSLLVSYFTCLQGHWFPLFVNSVNFHLKDSTGPIGYLSASW